MVSLASVQNRFDVEFSIVEGGSGVFRGVIGETEQNSQPNYILTTPRRVLRVRKPRLVQPGVVVQSPNGETYLVGDNGPSEVNGGVLWESFRLFRATHHASWQRRVKVIDPVTTLERDNGLENKGAVWIVVEGLDRESPDRKLSASFETARYLAAAPVLADDLLDGRVITRADVQLGLRVGTIV